MTRHTRTAAVVKLTRQQAIEILDQTLTTARAVEAQVALIRPQAFVACLKADPSLVSWERCNDLQHRPVYRGTTLEVSEQLYAHRQEKMLGGVTRGLKATPDFGRRA
jgi:hypothetical protein